jgi:hypothetical protein
VKQDQTGDPSTEVEQETMECSAETDDDQPAFVIDEGEDEDEVDWLEPFKAEAPSLAGLLDFTIAPKGQEISLTKKDFDQQFNSALERLGLTFKRPPSDVMDELFIRAIEHRKQKSAFYAYCKVLQGDRFNRYLQFIRNELERLELISIIVALPRQQVVPQQLSEWSSVWIGSLRDLAGRIESQLRFEEKHLMEEQMWLRSGRTKIQSHLLRTAMPWIEKLIAERGLSISSLEMLVAYAHASALLTLKESAKFGNPMKAMEMRILRAKQSRKNVAMLSRILMQAIKDSQETK